MKNVYMISALVAASLLLGNSAFAGKGKARVKYNCKQQQVTGSCTVNNNGYGKLCVGTNKNDIIVVHGDGAVVQGNGGKDIIYLDAKADYALVCAGSDADFVDVEYGSEKHVIYGDAGDDDINTANNGSYYDTILAGGGYDQCIKDYGDSQSRCRQVLNAND